MVSEDLGGNQRLLPGTPVADRHLSVDRGGIQSWRHVLRIGGACTAALLIGVIGTMPAAAAESPTEDWKERVAGEFAALLERRDTPANTCISVSVDGEPVLRHREAQMMVPASLLKLATITAAIESMGAEERFVTTVVIDADDLAAVRDGVLRGDVHLIGGGDPVLATKGYMSRFAEERPFTNADRLAASVMSALAEHGVRVVDGAIVGDGSRYADGERDYTGHTVSNPASGTSAAVWKRSYRSTNLVGPLGGLTLNDGFLRYRPDRRAHVRSADPAQGAASVFDDLLEARGLVIRNRPRAGSAPREAHRVELAAISSPPLGRIVQRAGVYSENTAAEMLLKEIGYRTGGSARADAVVGAAAVLHDALGEIATEIEMVDGSGLSVHNKMTCRAAAALLERMQPGDPLYDSLAVAGRTGTLRRCGPAAASGAAVNLVHAKSGLLNNVVAVAGRVQASSRHQLTFAVISNAPWLISRGSCPALRRVPITAAAKFTYAPDRPWFTDVPLGSADTAAARVSEAGLMALCDDDGRRFCPDDLMSRADLAVILRDVADLRRVGTAARPIDTADHPEAEAIAAVMAAGLMWSCDGEARLFCPDEPVSEFAAASGVMFAVAQLNGASLGVVPPGPLCGRGNPRCQSATRLDVAIFLHVALDAARLGASPRS